MKIKEVGAPIYVVQEHQAEKAGLHYDLRLQAIVKGEKVLLSWAVPKGMPETKGVKRLAIRVQDHALTWAKFKGTIPKGQYGAGTVKIWDSGVYVPISIKKDAMTFEIHGKRLNGVWKISKMEENNWILERIE